MPNTSLKFIYFDIGSVLCGTKDVYEIFAKYFGVSPEKFETIYKKHIHIVDQGTGSFNEFWNILNKEFNTNISVPSLEKLHEESIYSIKESYDLLIALSKKYEIGILSNNDAEFVEKLFELNKIPNITYSAIVISSDHGLGKPNFKIYEIAQKEANKEPNEIFFIDDRKENIEIAKDLGWQGYVFDSHNIVASISDLKKLLL